MAPALDAVLDHVALAVGGDDAAERRWRDALGGVRLFGDDQGSFRFDQYGFANGAKLELLRASDGDPGPDNFVRAFLARFGSRVHHVTLKVPDLPAAIALLEDGGLDVVDVSLEGDQWREAFLRPKQVGGLVVQVASSAIADPTAQPSSDAAALLGPLLRHPDLPAAGRLWSLLGATVEERGDRLVCRWSDSPLDVVVERGEPAGPAGLRLLLS